MSARAAPSGEATLFETLWLEGALFVPDLLEKASRGDLKDQQAADYGLPKGLRLQEEIGRAFQIALAQWKDFSLRKARSGEEKITSLSFMQEFLRDALGYTDLGPMPEAQHNGRTFPITHRVKGRVPVVLAPCTLDLDEADAAFAVAGTGSRKKSPFQLLQEFLNASPDNVWGLCANGLRLRLARDAETLTRPCYLEFDLETLLGEARYPDFAALWRVLHSSRAGKPDAPPSSCVWETWRAQGHAQGMRVRDGLRNGVTAALKELGQGFLQSPQNEALRTELREGRITPDAYFQELLRTVYRFLFLYTVEERDILATSEEEPTQFRRAARTLYSQGYSMRRLRDRCRRLYEFDTHADLWISVGIVFRGLAHGEPRLDLPALGGLFAAAQCPHLDSAVLENRFLLKAQQHLRWAALGGAYMAVDYRNMGPEELGSVYESLLELVPKVDLTARSFGFIGLDEEGSTAGNARKTTGSYYTPDSLVQQLLKTALDPVIEERLATQPAEPDQALLGIRVIDPACGSGHFLLAAARRLAERLAQVRSEDGVVKPAAYRHALREVIAHCIHGVDRNPMALELARTALWLEGFEPGRALSFLDHHLVCGDALLGVMDFKQVEMGIPQEAYKALSGDDPEFCKELSKVNKVARKALEHLKQGGTLFLPADRQSALTHWKALEEMPDATPAQVEAKREAYLKGVTQERNSVLAHAADLFVGAFIVQKTYEKDRLQVPTTVSLQAVLYGTVSQANRDIEKTIELMQRLCTETRVLHWPLAFPQIFATGGFDCVLGNPPWEVSQLNEVEYFESKDESISKLAGNARKKAIEALNESNPLLKQSFLRERRIFESSNSFYRESGRFLLSAVGKLNTYSLFTETISGIQKSSGRAGFLVPSGIATDDSNKGLFVSFVENKNISTLVSFSEIRKWFAATDDRKPFCLITLGHSESARFIFNVEDLSDLERYEKWFSLTKEEFKLLNPNTKTCPIFRSEMDAKLTKLIYRNTPVLFLEMADTGKVINPWGISFRQGLFNMSDEDGIFKAIRPNGDEPHLPLYEAKMIHQFDHRWATYVSSDEGVEIVDASLDQKQDSNFRVNPRYWVSEKQILAKIARVPGSLSKAYANSDLKKSLYAMATWIEESVGEPLFQDPKKAVVDIGGKIFESLPGEATVWRDLKVKSEKNEVGNLTGTELEEIRCQTNLETLLKHLIESRSPKWLMGWRANAKTDDLRTTIATVLPRYGIGHSIFCFTLKQDPRLSACFLATINSLIFDFIARQKVGGNNFSFYYFKQLPIPAIERFGNLEIEFIVNRVLELTYTSIDLAPWATDLGFNGKPFDFNVQRRAQLRAELDAFIGRKYGVTREELEYVLDPSRSMGQDYPTETFRVIKEKEIKEYGEYRTQRLILEAWDALP